MKKKKSSRQTRYANIYLKVQRGINMIYITHTCSCVKHNYVKHKIYLYVFILTIRNRIEDSKLVTQITRSY